MPKAPRYMGEVSYNGDSGIPSDLIEYAGLSLHQELYKDGRTMSLAAHANNNDTMKPICRCGSKLSNAQSI